MKENDEAIVTEATNNLYPFFQSALDKSRQEEKAATEAIKLHVPELIERLERIGLEEYENHAGYLCNYIDYTECIGALGAMLQVVNNEAPTPMGQETAKSDLKNVWNTDAPEGMAWLCPDCDSWATLGGNAGFHSKKTGHRLPVFGKQPKKEEVHQETGLAKRIVKAILEDLHGRSGIGDEFDQITDDIQQEIYDELVEVVLAEFTQNRVDHRVQGSGQKPE